jgi:hypothetical protein
MRPIDADALKAHVCDMCDDGQRECKGDEFCAILCWINDMPTIEPEVRHGRWIKSDALDYKDPNGGIHIHGMCSCCRLIYDFRDMTSRFKFCPDCGADMREVSEDADD